MVTSVLSHRPTVDRTPKALGRDAATEIRQAVSCAGCRSQLPSEAAERSSGGVRRIQSAIYDGGWGSVDTPSYDAPVEVRQRREGRRRVWL